MSKIDWKSEGSVGVKDMKLGENASTGKRMMYSTVSCMVHDGLLMALMKPSVGIEVG